MHNLDIVHGDLKPVRPPRSFLSYNTNSAKANILVNAGGDACLADFGYTLVLSQSIPTPNSTFYGGTARFMAPEVMRSGNEHGNKPTKDSDKWSLGLVMYQVSSLVLYDSSQILTRCYTQLFTGLLPFHHIKTELAVLYAILTEDQRPPRPQNAEAVGFCEPVWSIMQSCWSTDQWKRVDLEKAEVALNSIRERRALSSVPSSPLLSPMSFQRPACESCSLCH